MTSWNGIEADTKSVRASEDQDSPGLQDVKASSPGPAAIAEPLPGVSVEDPLLAAAVPVIHDRHRSWMSWRLRKRDARRGPVTVDKMAGSGHPDATLSSTAQGELATQLYFGFLPGVTKRDATQYAIGVAERNAANVVNAAYAVFPWQGGWAYEVHEGGPKRAFLPCILKFFDAQPPEADLDALVIHLRAARRAVRLERTRMGITGFLMPESFSAPQTPWLEPGVKLAPAVPLRMGVVAFGAALFATGFLAMTVALWKRPDPPPLPNTDHQPIQYDRLPISQWPVLVSAAAAGYVDSLEYAAGQWKINRAAPASTANIPAPPVPPPVPSPSAKGHP